MLSVLTRLRLLDLSQSEHVSDNTLMGMRVLTNLQALMLAHTQVQLSLNPKP